MKIQCTTWKAGNAASRRTYRYAHLKRDGHSLNVVRSSGDGKCFAWTSTSANIIEQLPPMIQERIQRLPMGTSLLGELWIPGKPSSAVKTALANPDSFTQPRYDVFAIAGLSDVQGSMLMCMPLKEVCRRVTELGFDFIPWVDQPFTPAKLLQELQSDHLAMLEGYVLKNTNLMDWCKLKRRNTIDLIVTGCVNGQGKYLNMLGALICSTAEGYEVARVSGMTDVQRKWMGENLDKVVGQVVEVDYQEVGAQGRLRHPAFVCLRDDKLPAECTVDQDEELAAAWCDGNTLFPE